MRTFLTKAYNQAGDVQAITQPLPSKARLDAWTRKTSRLFDPLEDASYNKSKVLHCPKCRETITVREYSAVLRNDYV